MTEERPQLDKFKDLAREVEADDDDKRFEERLRGIVKPIRKPEGGDSKD